MKGNQIIRSYKREFSFSYAPGAYAVMELLLASPQLARAVYVHSKHIGDGTVEALCARHNIPCIHDDRSFLRINQKENTYLFAVFDKSPAKPDRNRPHVVLVNPSDMGNLGTIIRAVAGCGIGDLVVVEPAADAFAPKTVRASMGAIFRVRCAQYRSFEAYLSEYGEHAVFSFMLDAEMPLRFDNCPVCERFALVFGNEAHGLGEEFRRIGRAMSIPQSPEIDSYNIAVAVGIGAHIFAVKNGLLV